MKNSVLNIGLLKQLAMWLDDNVDQGTELVFGESDGIEIDSELVLPSIESAINVLSCFVVVGRVAEQENIMLFIKADNIDSAHAIFLKKVQLEHDWNGHDDIYVDFCIKLSDLAIDHVYSEPDTCEVFCFNS